MPSPPRIRPARLAETALLSDLALRSKASWGYDDAFIEACRAELTLDQALLERDPTWVLEEADAMVAGFYTLHLVDPERVELGMLYVDPHHHGKGYGRRLFGHACATAAAAGHRILEIQSDPFAEPFYRHLGGVVVGRRESGSIPGRYLPLFEVQLDRWESEAGSATDTQIRGV